MTRSDNYFSTLFAMGFIICLPVGLLSFLLILIGNQFLGPILTIWLFRFAYLLLFFGGLFFILHFIFKIIEKEKPVDMDNDILDDEMIH